MRAKYKILSGIWDTLDNLEQTSTGAHVEAVRTKDLIRAHKLLVEALVLFAAPIKAAKKAAKARKHK